MTGGDLLAALGGPSHGPLVNRYSVDLLRVRADEADFVALAHVVARGRTLWRGPISAVLNADRLGRWDAAPRAHPGDGRFDIVEVDAAMSGAGAVAGVAAAPDRHARAAPAHPDRSAP